MEQIKEQKDDFYLASAPVGKLIIKFAIPCILSMLVSALYNIIDQVFVGMRIGSDGIFATSVVYPFTVIALAFSLLVGDGCAALFSVSLGAKDEKTTKKCCGNAIVTFVALGIVLALLGLALRKPILTLCGATPETMNIICEYYDIILIGIPFYVITSAMGGLIRADGAPGYAMLATVIGAVINLILDPIMILVLNWGMKGAALATIIGQIVSAVVSLAYLHKPKLMKFTKDSFKPSIIMIGKICKLGISGFITQVAIAVITIVVNNVIRAINDPVLGVAGPGGAIGVVFKIFGIVIAFSIGFAVGGQPIVGYNYGAKNYKRVFETYKLIVIFNVIVGVIATILFEACPIIFAKMFSIEDLYVDFACNCFRIFLGGILLCCIQKASCTFLQSINKPYKAMILSLARDIVFLVPGVCIFGLLGGLTQMLYAGLVADGLAFICTLIIIVYEYKHLMKQQPASADSTETAEIKNDTFAITVGREFGSGGKYIAQELAKRFNIKCYDNEILAKLAEDTKIDLATLETLDEKEKSSFCYGFATSKNITTPEDSLFLAQAKIIEELYNGSSCVIVGRCSDAVLRNKPNVVNVFVYSSDMEMKITRKMGLENLTREQTIKKIADTDKLRANYYKRYTNKTWGDRKNYDICIDTAASGVDKSIDILEQFIKEKLDF